MTPVSEAKKRLPDPDSWGGDDVEKYRRLLEGIDSGGTKYTGSPEVLETVRQGLKWHDSVGSSGAEGEGARAVPFRQWSLAESTKPKPAEKKKDQGWFEEGTLPYENRVTKRGGNELVKKETGLDTAGTFLRQGFSAGFSDELDDWATDQGDQFRGQRRSGRAHDAPLQDAAPSTAARDQKDEQAYQNPLVAAGAELGGGLAASAAVGAATALPRFAGITSKISNMITPATAGPMRQGMVKGIAAGGTGGAVAGAGHADGGDMSDAAIEGAKFGMGGGALLGGLAGGSRAIRQATREHPRVGAPLSNIEASGGQTSLLNKVDPPPDVNMKAEWRGDRKLNPDEVVARDASGEVQSSMARLEGEDLAKMEADNAATYSRLGDRKGSMDYTSEVIFDALRARENVPFEVSGELKAAFPKMFQVSDKAEIGSGGSRHILMSEAELKGLGLSVPRYKMDTVPPPRRRATGAREIDESDPGKGELVKPKEGEQKFYYVTPKALTAREFDDAIKAVDRKISWERHNGSADPVYERIARSFRADRSNPSTFGVEGAKWAAMREGHHAKLNEIEAARRGVGLNYQEPAATDSLIQRQRIEERLASHGNKRADEDLRNYVRGYKMNGTHAEAGELRDPRDPGGLRALTRIPDARDVDTLRKRGSDALGGPLNIWSEGGRDNLRLRTDPMLGVITGDRAKGIPRPPIGGTVSSMIGAGVAKRREKEERKKRGQR